MTSCFNFSSPFILQQFFSSELQQAWKRQDSYFPPKFPRQQKTIPSPFLTTWQQSYLWTWHLNTCEVKEIHISVFHLFLSKTKLWEEFRHEFLSAIPARHACKRSPRIKLRDILFSISNSITSRVTVVGTASNQDPVCNHTTSKFLSRAKHWSSSHDLFCPQVIYYCALQPQGFAQACQSTKDEDPVFDDSRLSMQECMLIALILNQPLILNYGM